HVRSHRKTGSTAGPVETISIVTSMLPRAAWRDGRARYVRPTTRPNSCGAPAAPQHALARTWRRGQTHPCTPLTYHGQRRGTAASGVDSSERVDDLMCAHHSTGVVRDIHVE